MSQSAVCHRLFVIVLSVLVLVLLPAGAASASGGAAAVFCASDDHGAAGRGVAVLAVSGVQRS